MTTLKDVAAIRTGHLFREKIEAEAGGPLRVIQVGDVASDGRLMAGSLTRIRLPEIKSNQLLQVGDCLFISRGPRKQAIALVEPIEATIATSQFFIIRPSPGGSLLPEFLAWQLNQRPAQRYFEAHSRGSAASLINLDAMKRTPVETPPIETQRRIVHLHRLGLREQALLEAIQQKRRAFLEQSLLDALESGESRHGGEDGNGNGNG
jgi:Type I restriction modification DNA specificity domain